MNQLAQGLANHNTGGKRVVGKLLGVMFTSVVIGLVFWKVDLRETAGALRNASPAWLAACLFFIGISFFVMALRFYLVAPRASAKSIFEAVKLMMAVHTVNCFLPAKLGDFSKSYVIVRQAKSSIGVSLAIPVYERLCDLSAVLTYFMIGSALGGAAGQPVAISLAPVLSVVWLVVTITVVFPGLAAAPLARLERMIPERKQKLRQLVRGWPDLRNTFSTHPVVIWCVSLAAWFVQLALYWLFARTVNAEISLLDTITLSSLVVLCGVMPIALTGINSKDVAFVAIFSHLLSPELGIAVVLVSKIRTLLPPLIIMVFFRGYLHEMVFSKTETTTNKSSALSCVNSHV